MNIYIQYMPHPHCNQNLKHCCENTIMRSFCIAVLCVTRQALMVVSHHWQQKSMLSSSSKVPNIFVQF